jgi:hypothetical protein
VIDVVVATIDGREADLERCVASYEANTDEGELNLIVVHNEPSVGRAWQAGLEVSDAAYVHLSCDDLEVTNPDWARACRQKVDEGLLPCPIIHLPDGTLESCGGDMRRPTCLIEWLLPDGWPVDYSPLPFLNRDQADAIGMIDAHYLADVYVSRRGFELGWKTVIAEGFELTHHRSPIGRRVTSAEDVRLFQEALS